MRRERNRRREGQLRVILTDVELPRRDKVRFLRRLDSRKYILRYVSQISENELSFVEIMLIDIALTSGRAWLSKERTQTMTNLKFVQSVRAGVDTIDITELPPQVKICGNVGAYSLPMAEHTLGMIIDLAKGISLRNWKLKSGEADYSNSLLLSGKTLGVLGAGGIGGAVAKLAKCLHMKTLGINTSGRKVPYFDSVYDTSGIDFVLKSSDVVVLALPLTVHTFHLITAKKLRSMKQNCILINVGRGYVIDETALYNHLRTHPEFKCGLDVWWHYPKKPDDQFVQRYPFSDLPNFLGTPHISGFVPEERSVAVDYALENVVRYVTGKKLRGLVSREDYVGLHELIDSKTS